MRISAPSSFGQDTVSSVPASLPSASTADFASNETMAPEPRSAADILPPLPRNGSAGYGQPGRLPAGTPAGYPQPSTLPLAGRMTAPASARIPRVDAESLAQLASPGDRRLEGLQAPNVVIHKRAPKEVKVGKPAPFVISVRNVGSVEATEVNVMDLIPNGMQFVDASPQPMMSGNLMTWQLGALSGGDERTITVNLLPQVEGELGSVARVSFEAAASVRTMSTKPELRIKQRAPKQVMIGAQVEIELEVSNPGSGAANGVVLQEDVPDGFEHPRGKQLDNLLGNLRPGESRREILRLQATKPGVIENVVRLISEEDGLMVDDRVAIEVIAPQVEVAMNGPKVRYMERQATYQVAIANTGTAAATNVNIIAYLDRGLKFVSTERQVVYDQSKHAVLWSLPTLPAGESGSVPLTVLPVEEGEQVIRLTSRADLGVEAEVKQFVRVDSLAELTFTIADTADPIELGAETTYEIRVKNSGSRTDSDIRVAVQLDPGLQAIA
ncbi:MAG: hypothetical protein AAGA03_20315, partial [Planctomycetota bacterium]